MEGVLLQTERFGADAAAPRKPWQDLNPIKKTDPARSPAAASGPWKETQGLMTAQVPSMHMDISPCLVAT